MGRLLEEKDIGRFGVEIEETERIIDEMADNRKSNNGTL